MAQTTRALSPVEEAERAAMLERQEGRDEAEQKRVDYQARIKALHEAIGEEYKRDLFLQPLMWAAQDLQPGYAARQDRTAEQYHGC